MLKTYAKWLNGSTEEDIEAIRRAMGYGLSADQRPLPTPLPEIEEERSDDEYPAVVIKGRFIRRARRAARES
jgi:hypothetical protein